MIPNDNDRRKIISVTNEDAELIQLAEQIEVTAAVRAQENCPPGLINPLISFDTEAELAVINKRMKLELEYQRAYNLELPPILVAQRQLITNQTQTFPGNIVQFRRNSPTDMELAQILLERVSLRRRGETVYLFNGRFYERLTPDKLRTLIYEKLRPELSIDGSSKQIRTVETAILAEPSIEAASEDLGVTGICLRNGILDLTSLRLFEHSARFFYTWMLDVDWLGCQSCPTCDRFFEYAAGGNPVLIQRLWEALAYAIFPDNRAKRFIVLMGLGDTGKSVWGDLVASFFEPEAVGSVDIFRMGDRFSLATLTHKRVNISMDLTDAGLNEQAVAIIKSVTGQDLVQVEEKYRTPYATKINCKLIFGTNHMIRLNSYDIAFWKRVLYLPFNYPVPHHQQNPNLRNLLRQEKPGIFWKALEAYRQLVSRGFVFSGDDIYDFPVVHQTGEQTVDIDEDIKQFASIHCQEQADGFVTSEELYQAFCQSLIHSCPLTKQAFSMRFKVLFPQYSNKKKRIDGIPRNGYCGMNLI